MSNHVFGDGHMVVVAAIMHLKVESHKVGEDRRRSGLGSNGRDLVAGILGPDDGEAIEVRRTRAMVRGAYGTRCGPGDC